MPIALLSDIHANRHALEAVLAECRAEGIVDGFFLGDLVGYAADASACVRLAMDTGWPNVVGNHDFWLVKLRKTGWVPGGDGGDPVALSLRHALRTMSDEELDWLGASSVFAKPDRAIAVHASVDEPGHWNYVTDEQAAAAGLAVLRGRGRHVAFHGHTHLQRVFTDPEDGCGPEWLGERRFRIPEGLATIVTVGAVGQPREEDGDTRAAWATWEPETRTVEFRRTTYDVEAAAEAIREAGLAEESAERLFGVAGI